jgi:hypothetical protein
MASRTSDLYVPTAAEALGRTAKAAAGILSQIVRLIQTTADQGFNRVEIFFIDSARDIRPDIPTIVCPKNERGMVSIEHILRAKGYTVSGTPGTGGSLHYILDIIWC